MIHKFSYFAIKRQRRKWYNKSQNSFSPLFVILSFCRTYKNSSLNHIHIARAAVSQKALVLGTSGCGRPGVNIYIDTDNPEIGIAPCLGSQEGNLIEQAVDLVLVIGADPAINPDTTSASDKLQSVLNR